MMDPPDVSTNDLAKLQNLKAVLKYTNKNYPKWIVGFANRYSDDFPHLTCTWVEMAKMLKTEPSQIMLTSYVPKQNELGSHPVLSAICDIFSRSGFMIRENNKFITCPVCFALLPTKKTYKQLTVKPPFAWADTCRLCDEEKKPTIEEISCDEEKKMSVEEVD